MTSRVDPASGDVRSATTASGFQDDDFVPSAARVPVVVTSTAAVATVSIVLTALTAGGVAEALPSGLRATIVCLVAVTLPGLPIAGLLKLPLNGIFASVAIAVSLATNILLAQLNFGAGLQKPFLFHVVLLVITAIPTGALVMRWRSDAVQDAKPSAAEGIRRAITRSRGVTIALLVVAIAIFLVAVSRIDTNAAGNRGLLQILGVDYFAGLVVLAVALAVEFRRTVIDGVMLACANAVLILYVTMPVAWADRTAPFSTAYVHAYITNWMVELGGLPPPLDARISWAGFFSTAAQLMTIGGLRDSDVFVVDASLVFGLLLIFPVYAIGLAISGNPKAAWLGVTIYVLFNWYQQDYFAPQAVAMQFYATVLAILLWQLRSANVPALGGPPWRRFTVAWMRVPGRTPGRDARWTLGMEVVLLLVVAAQVVAHQLTPVMTIMALVLFAAFGLTRSKVLWLAAILVFVAWFLYGAHDYWQGHLGEIIKDIGGVDGNLSSSVAGRPAGDPVYGRMQYLRIAASVLLFATAAIGWWRLPRGGARPILGALAVAPFALVLVQSYGGEVAIRCFLYASPVLAPLAAALLVPLLRGAAAGLRQRSFGIGATALVFFGLGVWVVTDRGLNTSFEHTTKEEVAVSRELLSHADAGQLAYWGQGAMFGLSKPFELTPDCLTGSEALAGCAAKPNVNYVVDSDQDEKYLLYQSGVAPETIRAAVDILVSDKGFEMMYDGPDIKVYKRVEAPAFDLRVVR